MSSLSFPPLRDPAVALRKMRKNRRKKSSFPLLRLPFVALREIIEKIEPYELLQLSRCSKRMHFFVKNYRDKSPVSLDLCGFKDYTDICLLSQKYSGYKVIFRVNAEGYIDCWKTYNKRGIQYRSKKTERLFSCENIIEGTKFLVVFLYDLFTARVEKVEVKDEKIWMLDIVEERQGGYSYDADVKRIYGYDNYDEKFRHILLDLNPRSLTTCYRPSRRFRIESFHKKYENLAIAEGEWVTVENLCQVDCVKLMVNNRYFSSTEINRYLKHVLSGGAPRLRKFRVKVQRANKDVIFEGIQELLTGSEQDDDEVGNWNRNGKVAGEVGLVLVSVKIEHFEYLLLEVKEA